MLIVACVEVGNYLGRGSEYVDKLYAMVDRHLREPFDMFCLTDDWARHRRGSAYKSNRFFMLDPQLGSVGWWNKVELFRPGMFPQGDRILYLDLDTIVVGDLAPLAAAKGILHLDRWGWDKKVYGSGVMVWDAGEHAGIWEHFGGDAMKRHAGDQDFITELGGWDALPDGLCVSYRYHCKKGVPPGAAVVCCHGRPKPHELTDAWAIGAWRG